MQTQKPVWECQILCLPVIRPKSPPRSSQRLQELYDGALLGAFQFFKLLSDVAGLAAVSRDRIEKC